MNTLKINKAIIVIWLAVSLLVGGGLVAPAMGLDVIPQANACVHNGSGGGCQLKLKFIINSNRGVDNNQRLFIFLKNNFHTL